MTAKWKCTQCGACCASQMVIGPLRPDDVARGFDTVKGASYKRSRIAIDSPDEVYMRRVKQKDGFGPACVYLKDHRHCTIYRKRPGTCRRWRCEESYLLGQNQFSLMPDNLERLYRWIATHREKLWKIWDRKHPGRKRP